jgi:hypothetical protein
LAVDKYKRASARCEGKKAPLALSAYTPAQEIWAKKASFNRNASHSETR